MYKALAPLVIFLLIWKVAPLPQFQRLENLTTDWRFQMRAALGQDPYTDKRLVLVSIDQESLDVFGSWPWSRTVHGDFLRLVSLSEPAVVAFDIFYSEPSPAEADQHFVEGVAEIPNLVTGASRKRSVMGKEHKPIVIPLPKPWGSTQPLRRIHGDTSRILCGDSALPPIESLRKVSYFGFIDCEPSLADGIRRTVPMMVRIADDVFPSLSFQTLCRYWDVKPDQIEVYLGRRT